MTIGASFLCSLTLSAWWSVTTLARRVQYHQLHVSAAGDKCRASITSKGNCEKGQHCYIECIAQATTGECDGALIRMNMRGVHEGVCRIPDGEACDSSDQCRPGSRCVGNMCIGCEVGKSQTTRCIELAIREAIERRDACTKNAERPIGPEIGVAPNQSTRLSTLKLQNSLDSYSDNGVEPVSRGSREAVLQAVKSAVSSDGGVQMMGKNSASRSGASFFITMDGEYLLKGFERASEYEVLASLLEEVTRFPPHTTMNVPTLAFPAFGNVFWLLMPNADKGFKRSLGFEPLGEQMFDVKPEPLISEARPKFLANLRKRLFMPAYDDRAVAFLQAVKNDLDLLQSRAVVDYSWLIYEYEIGHRTSVPTFDPVNPVWCFKALATPVRFENQYVLCLALIDYSLKMEDAWSLTGIKMNLESTVLGGKWHDYGDKFLQFTECLFDMAPQKDLFGLVDKKIWYEKEWKHFVVDVRVLPQRGVNRLIEHRPLSKCYLYRQTACDSLFSSFNTFAKDSGPSMCSFDVITEVVDPVDVKQQGLGFCLNYMVEACLRSVTDELALAQERKIGGFV